MDIDVEYTMGSSRVKGHCHEANGAILTVLRLITEWGLGGFRADKLSSRQVWMSVIVRPAGAEAGSAVVRLAIRAVQF